MVTFLPLAHGSTPSELVETSLGAHGSPPSERVDLLPWSAWSTAWIASLGACGSPSLSVWMVSLGSCGSPPFDHMDSLPRSLGACGCALGHTDGLAPSITARLPGVVAQRVHVATCARCCGHMHHRRAQSARATARRRNAKGRNDKRASLFQCFVSREGFQNPKLFSAPNYLSQLLGSLGTNSQFDLQGAKKISTFQSRIFIKEGILGICPQKLPAKRAKN